MKLFKRKKRNKELHPFVQKVLISIHLKLVRFAEYLQRKTNSYSNRSKKTFLLIFCFVFVCESIFLIVKSFQGNTSPLKVSPIGFIRLHEKVTRPVVTGSELQKIIQFKHYLDSNSTARDSILKRRPHLMDSINLIEKIYQSK